MPVVRSVRERFARERPLAAVRIAACLHVTPETAVLCRTLVAGGAQVALCAANPLSTQDEVAGALGAEEGMAVRARRGESPVDYARHIAELAASGPQIVLDDGADLLLAAADNSDGDTLVGGTEETATGLVRLRRMAAAGRLTMPVLAVNDARTERACNDRHGTGQSALDGVLRATNVLFAGQTLVVLGFGPAGRGVAQRARGAGAVVVVCEIDPLRALEARMDGYEVMPALEAAARGDIFITVTGSRGALTADHFAAMKDGAVLANAGHFDVEIDLEALRAASAGRVREVRPLVEEHRLGDGRRLNLLAGGRVVNLAAAEGHPAAVMDVSFALQALCAEALVRDAGRFAAGVHAVPDAIDDEVARLKLEAVGVRIDTPTDEQLRYTAAWGA